MADVNRFVVIISVLSHVPVTRVTNLMMTINCSAKVKMIALINIIL